MTNMTLAVIVTTDAVIGLVGAVLLLGAPLLILVALSAMQHDRRVPPVNGDRANVRRGARRSIYFGPNWYDFLIP